MKVEVNPDTTCWPSKCFIMMALTAKEKDNWFMAFQKNFGSDQIFNKLEVVMKLPANLAVNCLVELTENIKVLATDQGLYTSYENNLLRIEGLGNVEQVL